MLKDLFEEQRRYLNYFFDHMDIERAQAFFDACLHCPGMIILTGVGKSGIVAEKIAMTLISSGTKAMFIPPSNFLHGDIGILSEMDVVIMISSSGGTEDLLNLVPFAKKRKAKVLAMVSNAKSRLAEACDLYIDLPVEKELCPFGLVPTTSTTVQLLFGDALAIALMKGKEFSLDKYSLNHPSGSIGKKMTLKVEDLMIQGNGIPISKTEARLVDELVELSNKKCGCLLVVGKEMELLGIFTDGDLRRSLQAQGPKVLEQKIGDLMTRSALWVTKDMMAWEAAKFMQRDPKRWIMMLPVLEDGKVIGLIRMHDIIQAGIS